MKASKETTKKVMKLFDSAEAHQRTIERLSESSQSKAAEAWELLRKELKLQSEKKYKYDEDGTVTEIEF